MLAVDCSWLHIIRVSFFLFLVYWEFLSCMCFTFYAHFFHIDWVDREMFSFISLP